ncbi:hypothetical protein OG897_08930 [Streptomyces sp. NBC_00237]|uniref:hypothetical protein n=1 Tax=Streptomyces sp. NBC_00237 TaxID=2975687 RepID=UPI0022561F07|nr:hypothetical protein [Streptomyces sp. NBC_00237]MCX5201571.1 hypothetical protein [Streptomyces sp. NBC_00237]
MVVTDAAYGTNAPLRTTPPTRHLRHVPTIRAEAAVHAFGTQHSALWAAHLTA